MKQGTNLERGLAIAGIVLWGAGGLLAMVPPTDWFLGLISLVLLVLSIREYRRWVVGGPPLSSRSKDGHAYPRTAWFAVGAIPAAIILEIGRAVTSIAQPRSFDIVAIVVWIAAGEVTQRLLVGNAKRNEDRAQAVARPPMPPPMPPLPPAPIAAPPSGSPEKIIAPLPKTETGPSPLVSCAACGASNGPTVRVCHRCGAPMTTSTP